MDIQLEKKKGLRPKHYGYIALGLLIAFALYKIIWSSSVNTFRTDKDKLSITAVTQGKFDDYITINGSVAPIATIYMDAYEGGRVTEKLIEEGAMVKKGDIILKLENSNLYEQILASESNLALKQNDLRSTKLAFDARQNQGEKELVDADFELKRLKRKFEQNKALYEEGLIAKEEFIVSKEDYINGRPNEQVSVFEGLFKRNGFLAFVLIVSMLSLSGIPLTAGFWGKFFAFQDIGTSQFLWVLIFGVVGSAIGLLYYFKPIIACFKNIVDAPKIALHPVFKFIFLQYSK